MSRPKTKPPTETGQKLTIELNEFLANNEGEEMELTIKFFKLKINEVVGERVSNEIFKE